MTAFDDYSLFNNWRQFETDTGENVRADHVGANVWAIYILKDDAYIHKGFVNLRKEKYSNRAIWEGYKALQDHHYKNQTGEL